jgi:hypothetical protein
MNPIGNRQFGAVGPLSHLAGRCIGLHAIKVAQKVAQRQIPNRIYLQVAGN